MTGSSNPHLSDPNLRPFLSSNFSPVGYLNSQLPTPSTATSKPQQPTPSLSTLASQTQSHISTLNAQHIRLSNTLTDLTEDILRTSPRLAYEVELLRGQAVSLAETLSTQGPLNHAIQRFVPHGLETSTDHSAPTDTQSAPATKPSTEPNPNEPAALSQLRTLHQVRTQLQHVIQIFNLALSFPLPLSMLARPASSIVSIQAPDTDPDAEAKAQAALAKLKNEVLDMMRSGDTNGAQQQVRKLREVCGVWKGTTEERERVQWVEGLETLVGLRDVDKKPQRQERREGSMPRGAGLEGQSRSSTPAAGIGGAGFLRRLRDEIYLDSSS